MSDAYVVVLVPEAGRPGIGAELAAVASRVVAVPVDAADRAVEVTADPAVTVVLLHDPALGSGAAAALVVEHVLATGRPVVPVLPCSDTVKLLADDDVVIDTPNRDELRVARSPIGYPAELVRSGAVRVGAVPVGAVTVLIDGG